MATAVIAEPRRHMLHREFCATLFYWSTRFHRQKDGAFGWIAAPMTAHPALNRCG